MDAGQDAGSLAEGVAVERVALVLRAGLVAASAGVVVRGAIGEGNRGAFCFGRFAIAIP